MSQDSVHQHLFDQKCTSYNCSRQERAIMRPWLVLGFSLIPAVAAASPFYAVGKTKDFVLFVDQPTVKRTGSEVRFWELDVEKDTKPIVEGDSPVSYTLELDSFDCANDTRMGLTEVDYLVNGEPKTNELPRVSHPVVPESVAAALESWVCKGGLGGNLIPHSEDAKTLAKEARAALQMGELIP